MLLAKLLQPDTPGVYVSLFALFGDSLATECAFSLPVTWPHFPGRESASPLLPVVCREVYWSGFSRDPTGCIYTESFILRNWLM